MLYDRNPNKLANLLLFGEMHFDNRQILRQQKGQRLLSYQSEESLDMLGSFCITDFFGMLDDTPASKGLQHETLCIGVGVLPIRTPADADIIIDKVAHYITDTSYAYWLGNTLCTADGPDYNEHLNQAEDLAAELADIADDRLQVSKLYVSAYPADQVSLKMSRQLRQGTIFGTYLGHAAIESLSTNRSIWTTKEASRLSNDRLAFLGIGACSVTLPDAGVRGSTEAMLFANDHGIIGGIIDEMHLPVYFVGVGEQVDDLQDFDASSFALALFPEDAEEAREEDHVPLPGGPGRLRQPPQQGQERHPPLHRRLRRQGRGPRGGDRHAGGL